MNPPTPESTFRCRRDAVSHFSITFTRCRVCIQFFELLRDPFAVEHFFIAQFRLLQQTVFQSSRWYCVTIISRLLCELIIDLDIKFIDNYSANWTIRLIWVCWAECCCLPSQTLMVWIQYEFISVKYILVCIFWMSLIVCWHNFIWMQHLSIAICKNY